MVYVEQVCFERALLDNLLGIALGLGNV